MSRSRREWILVPILFVFVGLGLSQSRMSAQAQAPKGLTSNLFPHVMKSAEVDAVFAQIEDSWYTEADELWFVRRGAAVGNPHCFYRTSRQGEL